MNNETSSKMDSQKLLTAFALVDPTPDHALLALYGIADARGDWKDPIHALVTDDALQAAGVTIADVEAAIIHYTATVATVTREVIGATTAVTYIGGAPGYMVIADGYRRGPAGDH